MKNTNQLAGKLIFIPTFFLCLVGILESVKRTVLITLSLINENFQAGAFDKNLSVNAPLALAHVIPGFVFMVLGVFQFFPSIRRKNLCYHRAAGKVFLICSVVIVLSALILGILRPFGGQLERSATILFGAFMLYSIYKAYFHIRHKNINQHREWMIRVFSLGLAVSTIRGVVVIFFLTTSASLEEALGPAFWIAFLLHTIAAESWISLTKSPASIS